MLFDTHIHLDLLSDCLQEVNAARGYGVRQFLLPGVRPEGWANLYRTAAAVTGACVAPGIHPLAAAAWSPATEQQLLGYLQRPETVALGEIGLDAGLDVPLERQETLLRRQLQIAIDRGLPVILHCRRATGRLLQILSEERADRVGGILHAFTGSPETARQAVRLGFALGIGAPITWPEARRVASMVQQLPAEWLVLETDAPDQAPAPHRGETNRPLWLQYIHQRLAALRDWSLDEAAGITTQNARRVLRLTENVHD